ncbi:MAG: hypothetical protein ACTTJC_08255 [Campylobacter sp.]
MKRFLFGVFLVFILSGCSHIGSKKSNSFMITIVSAIIKINDVGFLHKNANSLNVQIYNSGVNTINIKVLADKICINNACYAKQEFNQKFFTQAHYEEFFEDILNKKPIYNGKNLTTTNCGFSQKIDELTYDVCCKNVNLNDPKRRIKIIIRELI